MPEGYYPDDGGTASNIDAAKTHVSETRLEQGSQQQGPGGVPADAAEDGPGEASSLQLSDEQVHTVFGGLSTSTGDTSNGVERQDLQAIATQ